MLSEERETGSTPYQKSQKSAGTELRTQSELIRKAVDSFLDRAAQEDRDRILRETAGLWTEKTDLPDWRALRAQ